MKDDKIMNTAKKNEDIVNDSDKPVKKSNWFKNVIKNKSEKQKSEDTLPKKTVWVQIRLIPIWLRIILILLALVGTAVIGLLIGYGYIGDGNPSDVLKKETWTHILDIIEGKE